MLAVDLPGVLVLVATALGLKHFAQKQNCSTVNQTPSQTGKLPVQYHLSPALFQADHVP